MDQELGLMVFELALSECGVDILTLGESSQDLGFPTPYQILGAAPLNELAVSGCSVFLEVVLARPRQTPFGLQARMLISPEL